MLLLPQNTATRSRVFEKRVSLISVLLIVALYVPGESALAETTIRINGVPQVGEVNTLITGIVSEVRASSSSGGYETSGEVADDSGAAVNIQSIIRAGASGARVDVRVKEENDGVIEETSVSRELGPEERLDLHFGDAETLSEDASGAGGAPKASTSAYFSSVFDKFAATVNKMSSLLFFFWK